ncbi:MAG TPA: hypothetical protein PLX89_01305 [Verrucomicrobiota bacterium]|nr:hypothetical protein [Verrucomicrobiota bacterium]
MTVNEAKEILRRCRPATADAAEPEVADALELVRREPELAAWWAAEQAWQAQARSSLRGMEPPAGFRESLECRMRRSRQAAWRRPIVALALAAAVALVFVGWRWQWAPANFGDEDYVVWRQRMARVALREYRMDVVTNSLVAVERFLVQSGSPTQVTLPLPVGSLPVMGGAALRFQNRPVSMICFDRGGGQLLWLFAIDHSGPSPKSSDPRFEQIGTLATMLWTSGDRVLLMAVQGNEQTVRSYL